MADPKAEDLVTGLLVKRRHKPDLKVVFCYPDRVTEKAEDCERRESVYELLAWEE